MVTGQGKRKETIRKKMGTGYDAVKAELWGLLNTILIKGKVRDGTRKSIFFYFHCYIIIQSQKNNLLACLVLEIIL